MPFLTLKLEPGQEIMATLKKEFAKLTELKNVAKFTKDMPREFINKAGNGVTQEFLDYITPLVGEITPVSALF